MKLDRDKIVNNADLGPQERLLQKYFLAADTLTILDVGACEGLSSVRYARQFPNAKVYAFEPIPTNIARIKTHLKKYGIQNVSIIPDCLSDEAGEATFYVSSGTPEAFQNEDLNWDYGNKSSSLLPPVEGTGIHPWLKFREKIKVKTRRLESFCTENQITEIDFIHMDVQGAELKVLEGAGKMLESTKHIWLEVENVELYKDQPLKKDVERFLSTHGFLLVLDTAKKSFSGDQYWISEKDFKVKKGGLATTWQKIRKVFSCSSKERRRS